ncbi:MAG: dihydroorotate dehydrogenase-like protein [Polyangiaceae bacterium]|nr:dihydroorotate dehydrogenase-like protein [Polyangiaceae bacterium]
MPDLSTTWLGLSLKSPLVVAASPLSREPDAVARAVDAGAGAVVMHSLFEEQLTHDQMAAHRFIDATVDLDAETQGIRPGARAFTVGVEPYLRELERIKRRVDVPVLASLNGTTPGGWTRYAKRLEEAGANALELNLYEVGGPEGETGAAVEARQLAVVQAVVQAVKLPVTVKLTPFYAALTAFVRDLETAGARGVAVFNRFYQPDILLDTLDVDRQLVPSTPAELPLRLHALARLSATTTLSLACTGGVHSGLDAAKAILSGAHVVQLASVLLEHGPQHVAVLQGELAGWLDGKGYKSSAEARGVLDLRSAPDPHAWERLNYTRMLDGWRARDSWRRKS